MTVDAPGTCHLVGCPDKGQHRPQPFTRVEAAPEPVVMGCGTGEGYTRPHRRPDQVLVEATDLAILLEGSERAGDAEPAWNRLRRVLAQHRNDRATRP